MKKLVLLFFILITAVVVYPQALEDNRLTGLDEQVRGIMNDYHAAGLAIAVIENGELRYAKGFGYRDFNKKLPVDVNTVFGIGSVTKSFTASLLGILADRNQLSLTDRPSRYIPELQFYNATMDDAIQIKNLLTHSTGIPGFNSECSSVIFVSSNIEDLIPRLAHLRPGANVGEQFMYNNYMYTVAGILVERITGKNWANNVAEELFEPLQMTNTYTGVVNAKTSADFSYGYAVEGTSPVAVLAEEIPTRAPAGDIYSTVSDMAKWVKLWMNEGEYKGQQILPPTYIEEAISPLQIMSGGPSPRTSRTAQFMNYGYGWMNRDYAGYYKVEHSGAISGYSSNVAFFPTEELGIIVLSNQSNSGVSNTVTDVIADRLLRIERTEEPSTQLRFGRISELQPANTKTVLNQSQKPSHSLESLTGSYSHPGFGAFSISYKDEVLYAEFPFTTYRLTHDSYNVFNGHFTKQIPQLMGAFLNFNFISNFSGEINSVLINVDQNPVEFERVNE